MLGTDKKYYITIFVARIASFFMTTFFALANSVKYDVCNVMHWIWHFQDFVIGGISACFHYLPNKLTRSTVQVETGLENPTKYHVLQSQRRQVE